MGNLSSRLKRSSRLSRVYAGNKETIRAVCSLRLLTETVYTNSFLLLFTSFLTFLIQTPSPMPQSRQLAAIMFTDIVGYTALMGEDEQKAFEILNKNRKLQKPLIEQYGRNGLKNSVMVCWLFSLR